MALPRLGKLDPAALSLRAAVALWALVVFAFWWPCLIGPHAPLLGDAQAHMLPFRAASPPPANPRWDALLWDGMAQYYPWRAFAARMARQGLIPLWNPHQFCGAPFVANGQSAFFYPPNWLFWVVEVRYAFGLTAALHYFLAGLFILLLAAEWHVRPAAGLVGAGVYAFGGFMVSWTTLPTLMNTAAWLPAVVWAIERLFRRRQPVDGLWVALTLAMTLLAGHLQIAVYVWLMAALHLTARLAWAAWRRQRCRWAAGLAAAPVAGLLACIQLLPTMELARLSPRGTVRPTEEGFAFRQQRALQPAMLPTLWSPNALGTPDDWSKAGLAYSETCGYVGRLSLGLAALALLGLRSRRAAVLGALAVLALLGAMGTAVSRCLYFHVPGLGQAGGFGRVLCVFTFAVAVLAMLGADWLTSRLSRASSVSWLPRLAPWLPAVGVLLVCLEVGTWARGFVPRSPRARVYPPSALVDGLRERSVGGGRVLAVTRREAWAIQRLPDALLPPNAGTAYGYSDVQGYDSLYPAAYQRFAAEVNPEGFAPLANGNMVLLDNVSAPQLAEAGVQCVVLPASFPPPGLPYRPWFTREGLVAWANLAAQPVRAEGPNWRWTTTLLDTGDPCRVAFEPSGPPGDGVAVSEVFHPGWQAYADGRPVRMVLRPPMFRTLLIPEGARRVEMVYRPASFTVGAFISLLALGIAAGWFVACRGRTGAAGNVENSGAAD